MSLLQLRSDEPDQLTDVLKQCPSLSARVLSVVNSAAFGVAHRVLSIQRAVVMLGTGRARTIALAHGLRELAEAIRLPGALIDTIWGNSIQKACAAKMVVEALGGGEGDDAFSLGLIQDLALPMLVATDRVFYEQRMTSIPDGITWQDLERKHFGLDHAMLGQMVLSQWGATADLHQEVRQHHHPLPGPESADENSTLRLAVFLAAQFPHIHEQANRDQRRWIESIYASCLAERWASPDLFLNAVVEESRKISGDSPDADWDPDLVMNGLIRQITDDTTALAVDQCKLEQVVDEERQLLTGHIKHLEQQASFDPLTKVLNRRAFIDRVETRLHHTRKKDLGVCCFYIDLDNFKQVNDRHGHTVGDRLLHGFAQLVAKELRDGDVLGRLGGDEFAVFMIGVDQETARKVARRIFVSLDNELIGTDQGISLSVQMCLGAVHYHSTPTGLTVDQILMAADDAMYRQKRCGKHGICFIEHSPANSTAPDADET